MAKSLGFSQGRATTVKLVGADIVLRAGAKDNVDDVLDYLNALGLRFQDFQPVMERFGEYLVEEHIPRQFKQRGTPKRWAPLNDAYAKRKRALYGNRPLLVATGRMKAGFKYETTPRTLKVINRVTAGQGRNKTPRWTWHQNGTETMPARSMIQIGQTDYRRLRQLAQAYLTFASVSQGGVGL